ncbi:MAG: DUF1735 and LamG domain-containing protein [Bacteroidota bacterium]|nr:DUF1735 and LamG domain-containing protein [Bacteroidota bacterium]
MKSKNIINKKNASLCLSVMGLTVAVMLSIFTGCKKEPAYKDVVLITGADVTNVLNFTVEGAGSSTALTATATGIVSQDISVTFKTDTTLITAYNKTNGTNFYAPPAGSYSLSSTSAVIKTGTNVSNALALTIISTSKLTSGRSYMIPVSINVTKGNLAVLKSSGVAFIKLNQVITTSVFNTTNAANMGNSFPKMVNLSKFTFEFRIKIAQFGSGYHISTVGVFQDTLTTSGHTYNLFRFGELSDDINQLQWINNSGKISSATRFATNTWYTVSCVFDGSTCTMYINGVADGSFPATGITYNFNSLSLISPTQPLPGDISEVRLWSTALTPGQIQNGFCGVDPESAGLLGYWKFNEGQGTAITDYSGHGYSFTSGTDNWDVGVKCPN